VYQAALRFIEVRMRSRSEVERYLRRKDFEESLVRETVSRLQGSGWLDDLDFARRWVADRMAFKPRSRPQLAAELAAKGIDRETARRAISELLEDDQAEALAGLVSKKRRQYYDDKRLMAYLARQGYAYSDIKKALSEQ